jgi:hypothetical protein
MKRDSSTDDWEQDPVWDLLRQSPSPRPGPDFTAKVLRAARLERATPPWWSRRWIPVSFGAALAAGAALLAVMLAPESPLPPAEPAVALLPADPSLADLQENYETEVLLAASEHLGDFSDEELVAMIGF